MEYQGGKMSKAEALAFEQNSRFALIIKMRQWDEAAKEINQPILKNYCVPPLFLTIT